MDFVDSRSISDGSMVYLAVAHGRINVHTAAVESAASRSNASESDEVLANYLYRIHAILPSRFGIVLDSEQLVQYDSAIYCK